MIFGTALTFFSFSGGFWDDYCLFKSSSLVEAYFDVYECYERSREIAHRAYKHIVGLSTVKHLTLTPDVLEVFLLLRFASASIWSMDDILICICHDP
jgi:hypothetical protein